MTSNHHQSVMFDESIEGLNVKNNGIYIDATFGRGGHTRGILDQLNQSGKSLPLIKTSALLIMPKKILMTIGWRLFTALLST